MLAFAELEADVALVIFFLGSGPDRPAASQFVIPTFCCRTDAAGTVPTLKELFDESGSQR